ncbi:hypothetical protein [Kangiella geojedonensis]|uniref:Uncharacterized protein n=1 Tax=Kangiella geojedonensis TaxID=914150 RepID=A0A0F6RBG8_9GAMM|nr:hypothetical protein [Kangiella geojedonensis]AKE51136.1 hypothetical protein TQ33_0144 [Kangiella geojedonensis]
MKILKLIVTLIAIFAGVEVIAAPLPCKAFNGQPVPYYANPNLSNVGVAHMTRNGQRIIQINPNVVGPLPEYVRQFWYAHECAHHALHPAQNSEVAADCYAIKNLRNIGVIRFRNQVSGLLNYISTLPGSVQTGHLPGPARANNLYACFSAP